MDGINGRATIDFRNIGELVSIEVGSSPGAIVAQHLIESSRDERNFNEAERGALEKQLEHAEQQQVDAMHDEADAVRAAGWMKGGAQIASGAAGIASASASYKADMSNSAEVAAAGKRLATQLNSSAKITEGAGSILAASFEAAGKDAAADATSQGNAAQYLQRRLKEVGEREDEARTQEQKAIDGAAQAVEMQARAEQATLFIRG